MTTIPTFTNSQPEKFHICLVTMAQEVRFPEYLRNGECLDHSGESTKWRRLYWVFQNYQDRYNCANRVLDFIRYIS